MNTLIAFVIVLGVLIFFHEFGHFIVARIFGVGVEIFSLGFGPKIAGKKFGITEYRLSAIPLGGYVKMVGEDPTAEIDPEDMSISFTHQHVLKRICIVAAGPFFNLLLAVLIFFGFFLASGTYILKPTIGEVSEGGPAYHARLQTGDRVEAIDGRPIRTWDEMAQLISGSEGRKLRFTIRRNSSVLDVEIKPELLLTKSIFGEDVKRYLIGVSASGDIFNKPLNISQALSESVRQTYSISKLTVISIGKLIQGTISVKTLGGPIMIAEMAGQQAKEGAGPLISLIALLSINLAVLNFLPIPVLDGGHLLFFFIELVSGRPLSLKIRIIAQQIGVFILILLMVFVFYNDLVRLFFK